ncbi:hypothetical protein D3C76_1554240 [compost metagenome]
MLRQFTAALMPKAIMFCHQLSERVLTRVAIKQCLLLFRFDELLMRVLTMNLNQ